MRLIVSYCAYTIRFVNVEIFIAIISPGMVEISNIEISFCVFSHIQSDVFYNFCRDSASNHISGYIFCHYCPCGYYGVVADCYSGGHYDICPYPYAIANANWSVA